MRCQQQPLQKGTANKRLRLKSRERGGSRSPSQSPSPRRQAPVWKKREVDPGAEAARKQWLESHNLQPIQEKQGEMEEEKKEKEKKEEEEKPLEKGTKEEPPLQKGDTLQPPLKKGHIMLDFHNVAEVHNKIPEGTHQAINKLLHWGIKVSICSWCFQNREKKVMGQLKKQEWYSKLQYCFTTTDRVGGKSKGWWCKHLGIDALVDDSGDILEDAFKQNIQIFPVLISKNNHQWWLQQGGEVYTSLGPAVDAYLKWLEDA